MPPDSDRPTNVPVGGAQFPPTLWSIVLLAGQNSSEQSHEALATLCRTYWFPLYAFLRRQGKSPHDAEDLTQGFMLHLLEKETLSRVKREKGKFRSFLLASLQYYLAAERSKQMAQKRGGGGPLIALDGQHAEKLYQVELTDDLDPAKVFDRRWSMTLLERTLARLESEFSEPGRKERFQELKIFLVGEPRTISCAEAGKRLGIREGAV